MCTKKDMLLLTVFFPLFGAILSGFFGRLLGKHGASLVTVTCLTFSLSVTLLSASFSKETTMYFTLYTWCSLGNLHLPIEFLFNGTTFAMLFVVLTISLIVHIYSTQYLANDPHLPRFMAYLSFFTFFMLILVTAENLIQLFLGWEGVGICSYLLINFWFTRIQANKAALKAVFVNKIGDIALLFALSLICFFVGSTTLSVIFAVTPYLRDLQWFFTFGSFSILDIITFFLLIGAIGKSAQIGLHVWLPDAMEGPTPVSALLHAATMVTAGVFLLIRLSFLFEHAPNILLFCVFMGALTAFFAATTGLLQNDLKRIIAFSTCSQLGYMFVACGLSQYTLGLFHLFNHAFFKALLFLAAGSIIHALYDEQDIRKMGGLHAFLPLTLTFFTIASLSLMGLPYLSGFYSKDLIIEHTWIAQSIVGSTFARICLLGAAFFTAAYSARLLWIVFFARPNFFGFNLVQVQEPGAITQAPLIFLSVCSIFTGYFFSDLFIGFGTTAFAVSGGVSANLSLIEIEFLTPWQKQLPLILTIAGVTSAYLFLTQCRQIVYLNSNIIYTLFCFLNHKWFFDKIYNFMAVRGVHLLYFSFFSFLDKGVIEILGPTGLYRVLTMFSAHFRRTQSGQISHYVFVVLCTFVSSLVGLNLLWF